MARRRTWWRKPTSVRKQVHWSDNRARLHLVGKVNRHPKWIAGSGAGGAPRCGEDERRCTKPCLVAEYWQWHWVDCAAMRTVSSVHSSAISCPSHTVDVVRKIVASRSHGLRRGGRPQLLGHSRCILKVAGNQPDEINYSERDNWGGTWDFCQVWAARARPRTSVRKRWSLPVSASQRREAHSCCSASPGKQRQSKRHGAKVQDQFAGIRWHGSSSSRETCRFSTELSDNPTYCDRNIAS